MINLFVSFWLFRRYRRRRGRPTGFLLNWRSWFLNLCCLFSCFFWHFFPRNWRRSLFGLWGFHRLTLTNFGWCLWFFLRCWWCNFTSFFSSLFNCWYCCLLSCLFRNWTSCLYFWSSSFWYWARSFLSRFWLLGYRWFRLFIWSWGRWCRSRGYYLFGSRSGNLFWWLSRQRCPQPIHLKKMFFDQGR